MKKNLILALCVAASPLFAGEPAPVTVVTPPAPAPCPISLEVAGVYGFAMGDIYDGGASADIDVYGADITAVYTLSENHSVNLRIGYTFGDECKHGTEPSAWGVGVDGERHETDIHTFTIMPGYRYTHALNDKLSVFAGANIGLANVSVKGWSGRSYNDGIVDAGVAEKSHDAEWGFAYSLEIGASYKMSGNWSAFATWGIFGSTAEPELWHGDAPVDQQWYHGFRLGLGYEF